MRALASLVLAVAVVASAGCATIFSRSTWDVAVDTNPPGQNVAVTVRDSKGEIVGTGTTPFQLKLKSGRGYFKGASYTFEVEGNVVKTQKARMNAWYFWNLAWGGAGIVLGMLTIDPLTGAMYKLPPTVTVDLGAPPVAPSGGMPYQ